MPTQPDLLTAANIAKELAASDAQVKKAIATIGLKPAAKKGPCNYYDRAAVARIKKALK